MNSRLVLFFTNLFAKLNVCYEESVCGKIFNKIWKALENAFRGSVIHRFFSEDKYKGVWENSIFGKCVNSVQKLFVCIQQKIAPWLKRQIENSKLCSAFSKWNTVSVRIYGLAILIFGIVTTFLRENSNIALALLILVEIFGLLLIIINRSINQLISGSVVAKAISGIFAECNFESKEVSRVKLRHYIIAGIIGLIMAAVCCYFGIVELILIMGAVLAFAFLMKYLSLGVFLTIIFSPILPTMVLVGLSFICAIVFFIHALSDKEFKFTKVSMNVAVVFFVISLLWGVVNSLQPMASLKQVLVHGSFILFYFVVINVIRERKQWTAMIKLFMASALIVALYGIIQNFFGINSTESWIDEEMFNDIGRRVYSFFNNPNVLGEFLVFTIPVSVALVWNKLKFGHRAFFIITALSLVLCMVFTWSRGAWLGMILAVGIFLVISDKRWVLVGLAAIAMLPILLYVTGNTAIIERFMSIGNTADTSTAYRVSIWQASVGIISDFWYRGIGIGSDAYKQIYPYYALSGAEFALHSHNLYLQYIVETGIIGIASLFAVILEYIKTVFGAKVVKQIKKSDMSKILVALGAGFVGFLFQGLTDYVWYNYKMLMIFWIIIALGVSGAKILQVEDEGGDSL